MFNEEDDSSRFSTDLKMKQLHSSSKHVILIAIESDVAMETS